MVAQARIDPKSVPRLAVRRMAAASRTGTQVMKAMDVKVQNRRIDQKSAAQSRPMGKMPPNTAAATITCRQSLARSAIRPATMFRTSMTRTGAALTTPIWDALRPRPSIQMPPKALAAPAVVIRVK